MSKILKVIRSYTLTAILIPTSRLKEFVDQFGRLFHNELSDCKGTKISLPRPLVSECHVLDSKSPQVIVEVRTTDSEQDKLNEFLANFGQTDCGVGFPEVGDEDLSCNPNPS